MSDLPHSLTSPRPTTVWLALAVLGTGCSSPLELPPSKALPPDPPPVAVELAFLREPGPSYAGEALPQFWVAAKLPSGQADPGYTRLITVGLVGPGILLGTTTVRAVGGIAAFNDLRILEPRNDYRLRADAVGLRGIRSGSFAVQSRFDPLEPAGYSIVYGSCLDWTWDDDFNDICISGGLTVVHEDGSEQSLSSANEWNIPNDPAWSPDGARIAFSGTRHCSPSEAATCSASIYLMNADGSGLVRLESLGATGGSSYAPAWSPDGSRLAFGAWDRTYRTAGLYVMNADGSNLHALGNLEGSDPAWSPDGTRIAFSAYQSGRSWIATASADGTQPVQLTTPAGPPGDLTNDWRPAWSSDGTRIAFTRGWRYADGHGSCQVFVMNADGSDPVQLTHDRFCSQAPAWSPGGATIAFSGSPALPAGFHSGIMLMNADGSNQRLVREVYGGLSRVAWAPRR